MAAVGTSEAAAKASVDMALREQCRVLKLPIVARDHAPFAEEARRRELSHEGYLAALLEREVLEREDKRQTRRVKEARFALVKTLDGFDFSRAPTLPVGTVRELFSGGYIDRHENVILVGDCGTGKTHLATALGVAACRQGRRVRFTTAASLVNELAEAQDALQLGRAVAKAARVDVLVVDELGYIPLRGNGAELLFQVLAERTERASTVITTNLPFSEWTAVIPDARLCKALLDRLTHRAVIVDTGKHSIRFDESLKSRRPLGAEMAAREVNRKAP